MVVEFDDHPAVPLVAGTRPSKDPGDVLDRFVVEIQVEREELRREDAGPLRNDTASIVVGAPDGRNKIIESDAHLSGIIPGPVLASASPSSGARSRAFAEVLEGSCCYSRGGSPVADRADQ